jgi:DNA modification methylase
VSEYLAFLSSKIKQAERHGISVDPAVMHEYLRPDQKDIACWALDLGAALIAPDAGNGKTAISIEVSRQLQLRFGGKSLIVTELGASDTYVDKDPDVGEGVRMGLDIPYVTNQEEAFAHPSNIVVTNYERIRNGEFDFGAFTSVWLDEGNYVKNMASETTEAIKKQLAKVKFKYIATATPSPNETLELVNYAHVLGICDRGQILTRFFQRNSVKAGELTLHPQHVDDFWLWVSSWCIAITSPKDLGYDYPGFELPKLNLHWIEVAINKAVDAGTTKDGQGRLFIQSRSGLAEAAKIKRLSIDARVKKAVEIISEFPHDHFILWHHLEDERKALNRAFSHDKDYGDMYGSQKWDIREKRIIDFTKGNLKYLSTKPEISGVGCNFQKHCSRCIFVGINDSFNDIYQALKRIYRFYQPAEEVNVYFLYTPEEYEIVQNIKRKWAEHDEMREKMRQIILEYGLDNSKLIEQKKRSFKVDRKVYSGKDYTLICTDSVTEYQQVESNSIDMFLTSIPFGNHYEYTDKYNDFGHNVTNEEFFKQMGFLLPEMLRALKPGRIAAFHTKNRIHYGSVTGLGFSKMERFTHKACEAFEKAGFHCMGFHYVPTDVVAENNQTYRLTMGEMQKDSTKMGAGIPEEIWIFRKAPTSAENAYADISVTHNHVACPYCKHDDLSKQFVKPGAIVCQCPECKQFFPAEELIIGGNADYSLAHWQLDADSFWRSSGNRYLNPQELRSFGIDRLQRWWKEFNKDIIYDYDKHVELLKTLDANKKLSRTFTTLPQRSNSPYVWNDVNRMHGLNMEQSRRKQQNHICPMPFDQVDRLIELYSNPGDLVADPFGGLGTTGVRALKKKRRAFLTELNDTYAKCAATYLKETEYKNEVPTLFDLHTEEKAA